MDPNSLTPIDAQSWFSTYKDLILVLAGGFCAAFGGFTSTWYRAKKARKIKMEETIGQQQVYVYKKALKLADQLRSILIQGTYDDVLNFIKEENMWVVDNEILLPPKFAQYWHSVRSNVKSLKRKEQPVQNMPDGQDRDKKIDELVELDEFTLKLANDAEKEIRKKLKLPTFELHRPPKRKS
jgi:hypothetical protein